jgi:transposase
MHQSRPLSIGLAVHKEAIAVAYVAKADHAAVASLGTIGTRQCASDPLSRKMQAKSKHLVFVSEAGPWGDWRDRALPKKGPFCWVVAPSLIPKKPGERGKTNRRDAITLARLARAGELPPVYVPQGEDDAIRALCRARADAIRDLKTAKFRLQAFLLRHDSRYTGQATWSPAHLRWRSEVVCRTPAQQSVCQEDVRAIPDHTERLARLEQELTEHVQTWRRAPVLDALQARRGVQWTVAVTTVAALGDLPRFAHPRHLRNSLG